MSDAVIKNTVDKEYLSSLMTNAGRSLLEYSKDKKVMLVFLRHFGCIFCKEALYDISKKRQEIESKDVQIVFVHMTNYEIAEEYLDKYDLGDLPTISDIDCVTYRDFGLAKGTFSQLFGFMSWVRGAEVTLLKGQIIAAKELGDGYQMPGIFMIYKGLIVNDFIHKNASSKPDYEELIQIDL